MPEERGYWGIEIGQAGLKALRLQPVEGAGKAVATNFDYVPHAKILSQPDAVPEELVASAIDTFLSRNDLRGDSISISVPGQSALARFIQLPPVEQSKVHQIVLYEAKQQIPFPLEDVIWDYQTLGGGSEESGYLLEAEVGLFAMKRDLVMQQLQPFADRKVEVDVIQVAPLCLFNFLCYDRLKIRPEEPFTPNDDHIVICEMGTDNTILVVTNGAKIWIRNVPIGGNHFTRALVKDMKLTFAKAEHLKCNATKSPDPKAVFQAMRPVFNDYVAEIQRSVGYFASVNRSAKITKVLGVGNGFKLAGLQKFLQQNLQYPVERVERFESLVGEKVLSDAVFHENILGFVVPYGLAVQAMGQTTTKTTLLPPEIATARKIRGKKPWAVLTAAGLLGMFALSAFGYGNVGRSVSEARFGDAEQAVESWNGTASTFQSRYSGVKSEIAEIQNRANGLIGDVSTRSLWLELMRAVNECLPRDTAETIDAEDPTKHRRIRITSLTTRKVPDPAIWFNTLSPSAKGYLAPYDQTAPAATPETAAAASDGAGTPAPPEWYVVTLVGNHIHHSGEQYTQRGIGFVADTLLRNLQQWNVQQDGSIGAIPVGKMGISHATVIQNDTVPVLDPRNFTELDLDDSNPFGQRFGSGGRGGAGAGYAPGEMMEDYAPPEMAPGPGGGHGGPMGSGGSFGARRPQIDRRTLENLENLTRQSQDGELPYPEIELTTFTVQFLWNPIRPEQRTETRPVASAEGETPDDSMTAPQDPTAADPAATPAPGMPAPGSPPMTNDTPAPGAQMAEPAPGAPAESTPQSPMPTPPEGGSAAPAAPGQPPSDAPAPNAAAPGAPDPAAGGPPTAP